MNDALDPSVLGPGIHTPDSGVLWSASEGQIVNVGAFVVCLLFGWRVLPLGYLVRRWLSTRAHRYELTAQRLRESTGVVARRVDELELYRVKDIAIQEPLLYRLFGRGDGVLLTSDRSTPVVRLSAVPDPRWVADRLREAVERCRAAKGVREID